jgi:hypothetical protein
VIRSSLVCWVICSSNPLQNVEKTFTLSHADWELLHKPNYDLQVKTSTSRASWFLLSVSWFSLRRAWPVQPSMADAGTQLSVKSVTLSVKITRASNLQNCA